ncbi:MAG: hypothetical protein MJE77_40920 [Proteobacteria bacterium]|nr:hypothetical protein [Pseudomonadota bacterium]
MYRSAWYIALAVTVLVCDSSATAQKLQSQSLVIRVTRVEVAVTTALGRAWDDAESADLCGSASDDSWQHTALAATAADYLCRWTKSHSPGKGDTTQPDLMVALTVGGAEPFRSYTAPNRHQHDFNYEIAVPVAAIPRAGATVAVLDQDGADPSSGQVIEEFRLTRDEFEVAAASGTPILRHGNAVREIALQVTAYQHEPRTASLEMTTRRSLAPLPVRVTTGEIVHVRASGTYRVTRDDVVDADGLDDEEQTPNNLDIEPLRSARHGAATALIGGSPVVLGACRSFVAPQSGPISLALNDRHLSDNRGKLRFDIRIEPPDSNAWTELRGRRVCVNSRPQASQ